MTKDRIYDTLYIVIVKKEKNLNYKQIKYHIAAILLSLPIIQDISAMDQPHINYTIEKQTNGYQFFHIQLKENVEPFELRVYSKNKDLEKHCLEIVRAVLNDDMDRFSALFGSDESYLSCNLTSRSKNSEGLFEFSGTEMEYSFDESTGRVDKIPSQTSSIFFKQLLMLSALTGGENCFKLLLQELPAPAPEEQAFLSKSLGFCACFQGNLEHIEILHDMGFFDPQYSDYMWRGASVGGEDVVKWLWSNGFHTFSKDAIWSLMRYSKLPLELITAIFESNPIDLINVEYAGSLNRVYLKAIHLAAMYKNETMLEYLLKTVGVDINTPDSLGDTALVYAIKNKDEHMIKVLVDAGATNIRDKNRDNSLDMFKRIMGIRKYPKTYKLLKSLPY